MSSDRNWTLLPCDLVEHQIGQVDLLMAMFPTEEELTIRDESEYILSALKTSIEDGSVPTFSALPAVALLLTLAIPDPQDPDIHKSLQLDINAPFAYEGSHAPDEAPRIRVRIQKPDWLSKAETAHLNAQHSEVEEDLFSTVEAIQEAAAQKLKESQEARVDTTSDAAAAAAAANGGGPLVRVWFYFPSISTRSKRDDFIINAPHYNLTGFLYAGKPGLLCVEGPSQYIDDYMKFIKTESWGDIPAHHKKVSERHREKGITTRVFADMQENYRYRRAKEGQRANRGDMKAIEEWLLERGLGDAFTKVLM
ncbi:conserved hypothetical protein [Verticillium alfalfae VaMs.102]|uniref:Small nuclear ribonucleoprotein Prp3 C-terminal domain-containing protein n=1 Tax=Verticillium alfalfae (strain VaMs.102 / ATCC MYA-4576 / FGSC 10136) TaxID=526221 RepID=C9SHM6_VERA1|nr:conserved hypothetical protein [Verticillium alfalfae VaMs.102]EEY18449.1 conserved hypothetical protein [Verticillium alfalfae VaMs.102]